MICTVQTQMHVVLNTNTHQHVHTA